MRWWPPLLTGLAGLVMTLGVALWVDVRAAQRRTPPEPAAPEPATVRFGEVRSDGEVLFPFARHIIDGEAQWLPLLLQLGDPDFLDADKRACISRFGDTPEDALCRVEYTYSLDPADGHVLGIEALVLPGADSTCRAYVECRLPGLASARLEVPRGELRPGGLRILDKVTHAQQRPDAEDEQREVSQLTELLATPEHPELARMPAATRRLQNFLDQTHARRLEVLRRRRPER